VIKSYFKQLKQDKLLWLAPVTMIMAFVLPNLFIIIKFLLVILALSLFYNIIISKNLKGFVK
jgi:hypothetical protein